MRFSKVLVFSLIGGLSLSLVSGLVLADETNSRVGTRNFNFLKSDVGARAVGLGGAFTGLSDDASALFYNPAGIAALDGRRLTTGYQNFVAGINTGFLGYIHPLNRDDVTDKSGQKVGVFMRYRNFGNFVRTDIAGAELGDFGAATLVFGGHYSRRLGKKLQAGANAKIVYSNFDSFTSTGGAVDLGLRYTIRKRNHELRKRGFGSVGLVVQNLGATFSAFTNGGTKEPLPAVVRVGAAGRPRGVPVTLSADAIKPFDNDVYFAVGAEYDEIEKLVIRAGWTSFGENFKTLADKSSIAGFSFGLGFKLERYEIGYAFTPMNNLGESHRITISHNFDPFFY